MKHGDLSEQIRERAVLRYVEPAYRAGRNQCVIKVRDLMTELEAEGFPRDHQAQFCSALQTKNFLLKHGLEIERIDGPAKKKSTTVVFHYRVKGYERMGIMGEPTKRNNDSEERALVEDPAARAKRLTDSLYGLLKTELAEYGGADGFMRWVRSDD